MYIMKKNVAVKQRIISVIALFLCVFLVQSCFAQVVVTTTPPSSDNRLTVGTNSSQFSVCVKNMNTENITLHTVTITPFDGVVINSDQNIIDSRGLSIGLANNVFTFNRTIAAKDSIRFTYKATATCEAIGHSSNVKDNLTTEYLLNDVLQSTPTQSDSYPILYPQFSVSNKNKEVIVGEKYDLITEVSNAVGAGSVNEIQMTITLPSEAGITVSSVLVSKSDTDWGTAMSLPVTISGNSSTYTLNTGVLESMGFTSGTSFFVKLPIEVTSYFDVQTITYDLKQMINGVVCEESSASGSYTLRHGVVDPNLSAFVFSNIDPLSLCDTIGTVRIAITNTSTHSISGVAMMSLLAINSNYLEIDAIKNMQGQEIPNVNGRILFQENIDYDGNGALGDYNGDLNYFDIKGGDTIYFDVSYHTTIPIKYSSFLSWNYISVQINYRGFNNKIKYFNDNITLDGAAQNVNTLSGEMDIDEFNVYPFYYNANFTFSVAQSLFSLDKQFFLRVSVPNGFKINNQDTVVMIPLTEMGDKEQTLRLFDTIYLQSTEFVTCGQYDIKWQTVFKEKNCSEDIYSILSSNTKPFYYHTTNGCENTPNQVFSVSNNRVNTGYVFDTKTLLYESQLSALSRYTEETCPNKTTYAQGDTMRFSIKGNLPITTSCGYRQIIVHMGVLSEYDFAELYSAELKINGSIFTTSTFDFSTDNGIITRNAIFTFLQPLFVASADTMTVDIFSLINNNETTKDGIEIRGSYSTVDCNDNEVISDTRGCAYSSVYHTLSYFDSRFMSQCDGAYSYISRKTGMSKFPNEYRPIDLVKDIFITKYNELEYDIEGTSIRMTYFKGNITHDDYVITEDEDFFHIYFSDPIIFNDDFSYFFIYIPIKGCSSVTGVYHQENGYINAVTYGREVLHNREYDGVDFSLPYFSYVKPTVLENNGKSITWQTSVSNTGKMESKHTLVEWAVKDGDSRLELTSVMIDGVKVPVIAANGKYYFVLEKPNGTDNIKLLPQNTFEIEFTATYSDCEFNDTINATLRTAVACDEITPSNFDDLVCDKLTQEMQVNTNDFNLVPSIPQSPELSYTFCEPIPYSIQMFLSNVDSSNVSYWLSGLSENIKVEDNSIQYEFAGQKGILSSSNIFSEETKNISNEVILPNIASVPNWKNESVTLSFNVSVECSEGSYVDITKALHEHVTRDNLCGATKEETFDFTPNIRGFENLQKIKISASADGFDASTQKGTVNVTTSNLHVTLVDSVNVTMFIPKGVAFETVNNMQEFETIIPSGIKEDGTSTVVLAFERGKYIQGETDVEFNATFINTGDMCSTDSAKLVFVSSLQRKVPGCNKTDTCLAMASSDTAIVYLKRSVPNFITEIQYSDTVCQGSKTSVVVSTSASSVSYTMNPTTAGYISSTGEINFSSDFTGSATVSIAINNGACGQDTSVVINILPKENITIEPVKPLLSSDSKISLSATPIGGTWSGYGVTGNTFDPVAAGIGSHIVKYTYSNGYCDNEESVSVDVEADCKLALQIESKEICNAEPLAINVGIGNIPTCPDCNVYNMAFSFGYDTNVLHFDSAMVVKADISLYTNSKDGSLSFQLYQQSGKEDVFSGGGTLMTLYFTPLTENATTTITISDAYKNGYEIEATGALTDGEIEIHNSAIVTIQSDKTAVCFGSSVELNASGSETYEWKPTMETKASIIVSPEENTTYTVVGTDTNGCVSSDSVRISVIENPSVVISTENDSICAGNTTKLTATGANTYVWNDDLGTDISVVVSPNETKTYSVKGENSQGCYGTDSISIAVISLPETPVIEGLEMSSVGLTEIYTVEQQDDVEFQWVVSGGNIVSGNGTNSISVNFTSLPATISVTASRNGCESNASSITVVQIPVEISGKTTICRDEDSFEWDYETYSVSSPNILATYVWSVSEGAVVNGSEQGTSVNLRFTSGLGTVIITVKEIIDSDVTAIGTYEVHKNHRPSAPGTIIGKNQWGEVCITEQNVLYSVNSVSSAFVWEVPDGDVIVSGQGTNAILVNFNNVPGNIIVKAQNGEGCESYSSSYLFVNLVGECEQLKQYVITDDNVDTAAVVLLQQEHINPSAKIYPQPVSSKLTVEANFNVSKYTITSIIGTAIETRKISEQQNFFIELETVISGSYILTLYGVNNERIDIPFIKQK